MPKLKLKKLNISLSVFSQPLVIKLTAKAYTFSLALTGKEKLSYKI